MACQLRTCAAAGGLVLLLTATPCMAVEAMSDWHPGVISYYGGSPDGMSPYSPSFGTAEGACGYGVLDKNTYPFWSVGALDPSNQFVVAGPLKACGECFEVQCVPGMAACNSDPDQRSVAIMITDLCPTCSGPDHIDLQALTFLKVAPWAGGRVAMRYRRIQCSPPQPIGVDIMNASGSGGWLRLSITSVAQTGSVQAVYARSSGSNSGWQPLSNTWGAAWEMSSAPAYPLDFRFVDPSGQDITAYGVLRSSSSLAEDLSTSIQFSLGGSADVSSSASATSSSSEPLVTAFEGPPQSDASDEASSSTGLPLPEDDGGSPQTAPAPPPASPAAPPPPTPTLGPTPPMPSSPMSPPCSSQVSAYSTDNPSPGNACSPQLAPPNPVTSPVSSGDCPCPDVSPGSSYTCAQQESYGKCGVAWMTAASSQAPHGYCAATCGRCPSC